MIEGKKTIGITGGSGSGKTAICEAASVLDVLIIDADLVARDIMDKDLPAYQEVVAYFGEGILKPNGFINRQKLADIVFNDADSLKVLNQITHKYILQEIVNRIKNCDKSAVIIDAAVLIGSGMEKDCDAIIAVIAPKEARLERIMKRDGLNESAALARINAQPEDEFYIKYANFVIRNEGSFAGAEQEAFDVIRGIIL